MRHWQTGPLARLLALGLTLAVPTALGFGVVLPLAAWHEERAEALEMRAALARRMEGLAASLPALRRQASAAAADGAGDLSLLAGDSDSLAGASLQERLQEMFVHAGVQLSSVEMLPGEDAGAYRRVRLRLSFTASWPVLVALLQEAQLASPTLMVDGLQVQPALHRIGTVPGGFDVSCTLYALRSGAARMTAR